MTIARTLACTAALALAACATTPPPPSSAPRESTAFTLATDQPLTPERLRSSSCRLVRDFQAVAPQDSA